MKLALDADKTEKVLKKQAVPLAPHATDATIARVNGEFQITSEKKGKTIDIKETKKLLVQTLNRKWNHKKLEVTLPPEDRTSEDQSSRSEKYQRLPGNIFDRCRWR